VLSLTAIAFWMLYAVGTCAALARPIYGVLLYVVVYHVNPDYQWWNSGAGGIHIRPSLVAAAATVLGMMLRGMRTDEARHRTPLSLILFIGFVLYAGGSLLWGIEISDRGLVQIEKIFKVAIFVWIMHRLVCTPEAYTLLLAAWLLGLGYIGYQAWGNVGVSVGGRLTDGIGGPDFSESSTLAAHLVASLPLIGAMFFCSKNLTTRVIVLLIGALTVNTIIMTRTRNVLAGLAALGIVTLFHLPRGYRLKGVLAMVAGVVLSLQLADPGWWARMRSVETYTQDASVLTRFAYWQASLQMAQDHPLGIGVGNFHTAVLDYLPALNMTRSAHSTYHECLAELGYPGLTLFIGAIGAALLELRAASRRVTDADAHIDTGMAGRFFSFHLSWHVMGLFGAIATYLGCALFVTRFFSEDLWLLVGMACCVSSIAHRAAEREAEPPELVDADRIRDAAGSPLPDVAARDESLSSSRDAYANGVWSVSARGA
jgi:probable O-glycosylation ligase (exosortase A-associated)